MNAPTMLPAGAYSPRRQSRSDYPILRGMRHHVRQWGDRESPPLLLVHGWMDVSASFQFLVDALQDDWWVIAPDLRGFGESEWAPGGYWFPDYVADLDALVQHYTPDSQVTLVGHSLGGNVAMHYAGVRPEKVFKLASLDAFGIPEGKPDDAPTKYREWLNALQQPQPFNTYRNLQAVADRLQKNNPHLPRDKALFLANHWARQLPDGTAQLCSDPAHRQPWPTVYRMAEVLAVWREISAPTLWLAASESFIPRWLGDGEFGMEVRKAAIRNLSFETVPDTSHMLHHDQPEAVASLLETFLTGAS